MGDHDSEELYQAQSELELHQKFMDGEINSVKSKLDTHNQQTTDQIKLLEKSIGEIKDMATRALHVSIGVDGRNGLRGSIEAISKDVASMIKDFEILKSTAKSYTETKSLLLQLFSVSAAAVVAQLCGIVWYFASQHSRQEVMREDLNRVILSIEKIKEEAVPKKS